MPLDRYLEQDSYIYNRAFWYSGPDKVGIRVENRGWTWVWRLSFCPLSVNKGPNHHIYKSFYIDI